MMFMSFNSDTTGATSGTKTAYPSRVVIGTDCIGSCKSNYHMIMTTTARHRSDFTKPTKKRKSASGSIEYTIKKES